MESKVHAAIFVGLSALSVMGDKKNCRCCTMADQCILEASYSFKFQLQTPVKMNSNQRKTDTGVRVHITLAPLITAIYQISLALSNEPHWLKNGKCR